MVSVLTAAGASAAGKVAEAWLAEVAGSSFVAWPASLARAHDFPLELFLFFAVVRLKDRAEWHSAPLAESL